jgi:hypothetical protein
MFAPKGLNLALTTRWYILSMLIGWKSGTSTCRKLYSAEFSKQNIPQVQITDLGNHVPRLLPSHALKLRKDPGWGWSRDTPESGVFSISVLREDVHKNQT